LRRHLAQQIDRALDISAKAVRCFHWIFAEVRGEVNYDVVSRDSRRIERIQNVELGTPREIVSVKEAAHVRAEVTAPACNKNSQVM
jgi:hypothetical protein